jgi:3-deoxy-D-manno-octulosonate 8-phosphate phosphatase (KDO 8-P phosphatase)
MALFEKLSHLTTFLFDIDGVFTASGMLATEDGELLRTVNTRDGLAVKKALNAGLNVGIITKGNSQGVYSRFKNLGVEHIYVNMADKVVTYQNLKAKLNFEDHQALYMGDDISDLGVLKLVGVPACPYDACHEVIEASEFISSLDGGYGAVRQILEKVLRLQGKW